MYVKLKLRNQVGRLVLPDLEMYRHSGALVENTQWGIGGKTGVGRMEQSPVPRNRLTRRANQYSTEGPQ